MADFAAGTAKPKRARRRSGERALEFAQCRVTVVDGGHVLRDCVHALALFGWAPPADTPAGEQALAALNTSVTVLGIAAERTPGSRPASPADA